MVSEATATLASSGGHKAGPRLPKLWRRSRCSGPRGRSSTLGLPEAQASGEAERRKPLRPLRLAVRHAWWGQDARGTRHALLSLPLENTYENSLQVRPTPANQPASFDRCSLGDDRPIRRPAQSCRDCDTYTHVEIERPVQTRCRPRALKRRCLQRCSFPARPVRVLRSRGAGPTVRGHAGWDRPGGS
jgi:hypothetical protein